MQASLVGFSACMSFNLFILLIVSLFVPPFLIKKDWKDACDRYGADQQLKFINNWNVVEYEVMNTNYSFHV